MYSEEITAIVIDIGSSAIRTGYSGEDTPKFYYPSNVGLLEENEIKMEVETTSGDMISEKKPEEIGNKRKRYIIGDKVKGRLDKMEILSVQEKGIYENWEALENLLKETYASQLKIKAPEYPLLMSEPSIHNSKQREKLCEIVFESVNVPNFFLCKAGVLSCFSSGRSTSLILDSGASCTYTIPVHDGYALQKSILKYDIGGDFINDKIMTYLENERHEKLIPRYAVNVHVDKENRKINPETMSFPDTHPSFDLFSKFDLIRDIKENICRIPEENPNPHEKVDYELPDGRIITFGEERFGFTDCLFSNKIDTKEPGLNNFKGIHTMIMDSINKCDMDIKKELLTNIIVCGGNTLLNGFVDKLQKKLYDIAPQNAKVKIIAYPSSIERKFSTWIGGSILASLGSFQNMWIGKSEYNENGSYIVEKKCP